MKNTNTLSLTFVFLLFTLYVSSQNDFQHKKDSLLQQILILKGKQKLDAYASLCRLPYEEQQFEELQKYLSDYIQEAKRQNNRKEEAFARNQELTSARNYGKYEHYFERVNEHLKFFSENKLWDQYFYSYSNLITLYSVTGKEKEAIENAEKLYEEAKKLNIPLAKCAASFTIGYVYKTIGRYDEAISFYKEAISLENKLENKDFVYKAYAHLIPVLCGEKKMEGVLDIMNAWEKLLKNHEQELQFAHWMNLYNSYTNIYLEFKDYDKAQYYNKLAMEHCPNAARALGPIYSANATIYMARGEYEKALEQVDSLYRCSQVSQGLPVQLNVLKMRAGLLCKIGKGKEGAELYEKILFQTDSLSNAEQSAQLDELRTQYEVDKHISEKEKIRTYMYFALVGCILLIITLSIWIYYNRQIAKKNKTLVNQIRQLKTQQEKAEVELLNKTTFEMDKDADDNNLCPEKRKDQLCIAIRDIILKEKAYRNPLITRDNLIERLNTNKELFIDAFQYYFGMSFTEYINFLRLKDAITLLEGSDLPIEEISVKAGFGTVRTFQRQFQSRYNMSPRDYRKAAVK